MDPPSPGSGGGSSGEEGTPPDPVASRRPANRYDEQKQRDWKSFLRYLENRKPRVSLSRVRSTHVIDFLKSLDASGKTLIHQPDCPHFGRPDPPALPCACPLRQSWGSLDALVGRLRRCFQEAPSRPETNPFGVRSVRNYLLYIKDHQATARGIPYSRKRKSPTDPAPASAPAIQFPPPVSADAIEAFLATTPPPLLLPHPPPPPGSVSPDDPTAQMHFCWVRPPVTDNDSAPPFYPVWQYPSMQSLMPFMPPFPYMPTEMLAPKQENQIGAHPSAMPSDTLEEESSSSSEDSDSDSDSLQAPPNHSSDRSWQRNRYLQQKGRDWKTFMRYLENRQPKLTLSKVRSTHVLEFLESIERVGKTLVHESVCPYFGNPNPPASCACPLRQSWGSLDAMVGRLRSLCEENPDRPNTNPFGVRAVRNYLLQIKDIQATARGIPYSRKRKPKQAKLPNADNVPPEAPSDEVMGVGGPSNNIAASTDVSCASLAGEGSGEQVGNFSTYEDVFPTAHELATSANISLLINESEPGF